MILLIDNYDSFVYNLARYVGELNYNYIVKRNDKITLAEINSIAPTHIILSPGPCTPNEAGITLEVINYFKGKIPMLGVCLGHQAIAQAFGAQVIKAKNPTHGKSSLIQHNGTNIFFELPNPLRVARYHSLAVNANNLPSCLTITSWTDDHEVMSLQHTYYSIFGVQFHPESILAEAGYALLKNFLT